MYSGVRQCGFIPVLQSFGSAPLDLWEVKVQNGCVRRITDEQVRALALEITGPNVSTCYVYCPKNPRHTLGIHMPYLVMIVKNMKKYFTFEITILDDRNVHRRFRLSNFQRMHRIDHFCTSMPLCLNPGWNEMYFNLHDFTRKAYKTNYVETTRVQIHANCRLRVIYFCDRIYEDKDIPQKYKMFLPTTHICCKKSAEEVSEKKEDEFAEEIELEADYYGEEEEEEEELYLQESRKTLAEGAEDKVEQKAESIKDEGAQFIMDHDLGEGEGGFYDDDDDDAAKVKQEEPEKAEEADKPAEETDKPAEENETEENDGGQPVDQPEDEAVEG